MGRPKELSQEERAELIRRGYRPVEIWVPDLGNDALRLRLRREAQKIAEADMAEDLTDWEKAGSLKDWDRP